MEYFCSTYKFGSVFNAMQNQLKRRIYMTFDNKNKRDKLVFRIFAVVAILILATIGTITTYAISNQKKEAINENSNSFTVEKVTAEEYTGEFDEIKSGDSKSFGGYALQKGSSFTINYKTTSNDLDVYLVEYHNKSLNDAQIIENNSDYKIPQDGHYYFLLKNCSETEDINNKVEISVKINNNL